MVSVVNDYTKRIETVVGELSNEQKEKVQKLLLSLYNKANSDGYQEAVTEARDEIRKAHNEGYEEACIEFASHYD